MTDRATARSVSRLTPLGRSWRASPVAPELVLLLALAAGLRLFHIAEYTTFQGDQGIDALAAKRLLVDHIFPVQGPATSAGGVHLGPLYYYLLAIPMMVVWLDPLADAVSIALLGTLATGLLYVVARLWFGRLAAFVAATLFAISPALIESSRSAWNPAPAPFFVLLALVALEAFRRHLNGLWLLGVGFALGCIVQFHYFNVGLALVLLGAQAWLLARNRSWRLAVLGLLGLCAGAALLVPFVVHEIASSYPNVRAAATLIGGAEADAVGSLPRRLYAVATLVLVGRFMASGVEPLAIVLVLALAVGLGLGVKVRATRFGSLLVACALGAALVQAAVYRGPIPEHYVLAYTPLAYLALAAVVARVPRVRAAQSVGALAFALLVAVNASNAPFGVPDRQLLRVESVAAFVQATAGASRYGLQLLADADTDGAYRYDLERLGSKPVTSDETQPDQLFVVCQARPCDLSTVLAAAGPDWTPGPVDVQAQFGDVRVVRLVAVR